MVFETPKMRLRVVRLKQPALGAAICLYLDRVPRVCAHQHGLQNNKTAQGAIH
jgi:hypothetical protein